jgi:hypothetical protein
VTVGNKFRFHVMQFWCLQLIEWEGGGGGAMAVRYSL